MSTQRVSEAAFSFYTKSTDAAASRAGSAAQPSNASNWRRGARITVRTASDEETKVMTIFRPVLLLGLAISTVVFAADADLILRNGKILTVDAAFSIRQSIAIKAGRIVAAGSDDDVLRAEKSARTRI